jgi:hypothetical protein
LGSEEARLAAIPSVNRRPGHAAGLPLLPRLIVAAGGFVLLVVTQALVLLWGGDGGSSGSALQQLVAVLLACSLGAGAVLWVVLDHRFEHWRWRWIFGLALLLRLIAIQAPPLLEDDHYRYLWDGLRTATALDPYRLPPSAFFGDAALAPVWQQVLSGINNPDVPTLYGPVLQALFAVAYGVAPAEVGAIKFILLVLDMVALALLARLGAGKPAVLILAVHPLVLKEAMASVHPDGIVALFLLMACFAWQRRSPVWMGITMALAVCTKVAALVALPLLLLRPMARRRTPTPTYGLGSARCLLPTLAGFALTVAVLYAPFAWRGGSELAGLATFAQQWRFNPLLYQVIAAVTPASAVRPVTAVSFVVLWACIAGRWQRQAQSRFQAKVPASPPLDQALLLLLLLSPVVNPWYWLWLLALSLHRGQAWPAVAVSFAPLAYLNSTVLGEAGLWGAELASMPYSVWWPASLMQALILFAAWRWRHHLVLNGADASRPRA